MVDVIDSLTRREARGWLMGEGVCFALEAVLIRECAYNSKTIPCRCCAILAFITSSSPSCIALPSLRSIR
jgi:hypothetical protein